MAQPDISQILAALAQQQQQPGGTPQSSTPQQLRSLHAPPGYPPGVMAGVTPSQTPSYLPPPSTTGSVDLSSIKPVNSGSVSITDAIAKAKSIARDSGISHDGRPSPASARGDSRRGYQGARSRSRSPARRDHHGSNPYRDERREDSRRGGGRRSPSAERNPRGSRDPPGNSRSSDVETETIRVKSSLVGLIIGRNGENLRRVESESGARVQFIQAKDSHVPERQCTISGPVRARESAKNAIFSIIEDNGGSLAQEKGAYTAGMSGRAKVNLPAPGDGEASSQIMIPDKTVGLIIGRGGETIKDLQERSGCHVNIVGENKSVNRLRPVNLIGSDRATAMAKQLILEIVESDSRLQGANAVPPSNAHSSANSVPPGRDRGFDTGTRGSGGRDHAEKSIQVPSEAVGMIIGKGGETIKDMQRTTGCKINVNQPKPPDLHRNIDLSGPAGALEEAERIIWEKVDTVRQRDAAAGRGHGNDPAPSSYDSYSQSQQAASALGYGQYLGSGAGVSAAQAAAYPQVTHPGAQQPSDQSSSDPYAMYGGQAAAAAQWYAQYYAQHMASLEQQQQQPGAPPGGQ